MAEVKYLDIWSRRARCYVRFSYFRDYGLVSNRIASYIFPWA